MFSAIMARIGNKGDAKPFDINGDGSVDFGDVKAIFTGERFQVDQSENIVERRVREIWAKHEYRFVLLSTSIQKRERIGRHWLRSRLPFNQDSKVNSVLANISGLFEDRELLMMRTEFMACISDIKKLDTQLADVKTSSAMQSETKSDKHLRAVAKLESKIAKEKSARGKTLESFRIRMDAYGVTLTEPQAEVLLSRIDAGDVTRMATVFVVLSGITKQFSTAKKESGENVQVAKKYYAIYMGLLELQIHIQSQYIDRIDNSYLPGVQRIGNDARNLAAETRAIMKTAAIDHHEAYMQNIESQDFTASVTEMYERALKADRDKVIRARALVEELHKLAENTLSTVRVSADLMSLVRQAEGMYQEVMSLQTPVLVPFENLQLQREFEAVTVRLRTM